MLMKVFMCALIAAVIYNIMGLIGCNIIYKIQTRLIDAIAEFNKKCAKEGKYVEIISFPELWSFLDCANPCKWKYTAWVTPEEYEKLKPFLESEVNDEN